MRYFFPMSVNQNGWLIYLLFGEETTLSPGTYFTFMGLAFIFTAIVSYLLGSINTAILVSKGLYKSDVRESGSGNAGMTNMFRTFGKKAGFLTLGGDVLKALIAVVLGYFTLGGPGQYVAGFFCMIGHVFPLYFGFKGGKGVIVSAITVLLIDPLIFLVLAVIFGLMFLATQIISASSITAAFFYPMIVYAFNMSAPNIMYFLFSLMIAFFVIAMHKENIHRILNKTEKKFTIHKDKKEKK